MVCKYDLWSFQPISNAFQSMLLPITLNHILLTWWRPHNKDSMMGKHGKMCILTRASMRRGNNAFVSSITRWLGQVTFRIHELDLMQILSLKDVHFGAIVLTFGEIVNLLNLNNFSTMDILQIEKNQLYFLNVIYYISYKTFFLHTPHSTFFFHGCYQSKLSRPLNKIPQNNLCSPTPCSFASMLAHNFYFIFVAKKNYVQKKAFMCMWWKKKIWDGTNAYTEFWIHGNNTH